jgi:hypothetical protein
MIDDLKQLVLTNIMYARRQRTTLIGLPHGRPRAEPGKAGGGNVSGWRPRGQTGVRKLLYPCQGFRSGVLVWR